MAVGICDFALYQKLIGKRQEMKILRFSLIALLLGGAAYLIAWRWAVRAVLLTHLNGPITIVDMIKSQHPVRVVNPQWIKAGDRELLVYWQLAEVQGRLAVVFLIWCGAMIVNFKCACPAASKNDTVAKLANG